MSSGSEFSLEEQLKIKELKENKPSLFPKQLAAWRKAYESGELKPFEPFTEYPWVLNDCLPTPAAVQEMAEISKPPRVVRVKTARGISQKDDPNWKERELEVCLVDEEAEDRLYEKSQQGNYEAKYMTVLLNERTRRATELHRK